ncbi:MAG TPA: VWA domain-containing protein [Thermoanaerobaculia bacterium]|nr:VWA domain-containing protein [Thermoanaerobaculia bacterium]
MRFRGLRSRALPAIVFAGICAATAQGATPGGGAVHEHAGVSLVEVPVTVVDRDGKPVRGLTAADFEVRDDGKEVAIQAVDTTEFSTAHAAAPVHENVTVSAAARRRFLLLFDLSYSTPARVTRIRDAARKFVLDQMGPEDLGAVATYSVSHGVKLLVTFTSDREQLAAAVQTLGLANEAENSPDPLRFTILNIDITPSGQQIAGSAGGRVDVESELRQTAAAAKRNDDAYRRGRITEALQSFGTLAKALDSVEGRKQVIYFSQGFDMRLLQGNAQDTQTSQEQSEAAARGAVWTVDSQQRFGNTGLQSGLNDVLELFKRSDCVIQAVDLSGIAAPQDQGTEPGGGGGKAALFAIADGTGGKLFENANDFSGQLDKLLEEESVVYVLTFSPKLTGHPDRFHPLKVRVKRSGVRLSARAGYYEPKPFKGTSTVEKNLSAADVIASEIPMTAISPAVLAQTFAGKSGPETTVQVRVPASDLVSQNKSGKLPIEIYSYAFDSAGKVADFATESAMLDLEQVRSKLESGGLRWFAQLKLAPGTYRLRSLVRDSETGAMGFVAQDVVVPDFSQRAPYLVAPLAVGSIGGLVLRSRSVHAGEAPSFPYIVGSDPFLPEPNPSVGRDQELKICVYTYGFGDAAQLRLGGQILDAQGKPLGTAAISLIGRSAPDELGRSTYLLGFKPVALVAGRYQIRIIAQNGETARQGVIPIEVR